MHPYHLKLRQFQEKMAGRGRYLPAEWFRKPSTAGFRHASGLGTLGPLDDFKFDRVSFLQSAISFPGDCGIVNKNVWAIIAPDEAISFRIVKPFDGSLHFDCLLTGIHEFSSHGGGRTFPGPL
jgi:hypothetical protein